MDVYITRNKISDEWNISVLVQTRDDGSRTGKGRGKQLLLIDSKFLIFRIDSLSI